MGGEIVAREGRKRLFMRLYFQLSLIIPIDLRYQIHLSSPI